MPKILAIDLGASSGRVVRVAWGASVVLEELHRFDNRPKTVDGTLVWDVRSLFDNIRIGLQKAAIDGFDAIGLDTWGVDFALVDEQNQPLAPPAHYRDVRHETAVAGVHKTVSQAELYAKTGIQFLPFNSVYQLAWLVEHQPELTARAHRLLFVSDLLCAWLTGVACSEPTMASTSGLLDCSTKNWDFDLCKKLGIPNHILPDLVPNGGVRGTLLPDFTRDFACSSTTAAVALGTHSAAPVANAPSPIPVIAVGGHDTASAVAGCPGTPPFVYLSCGTWSLMGTEQAAPCLEDAFFTNETGVYGTTRLLKNIMGMWLIQEIRRQWQQQGRRIGFDEMSRMASEAATDALIDPDAPDFAKPCDMPAQIRAYLARTNQPQPQNDGELLRVVYQSCAMKYADTLARLCSLNGWIAPRVETTAVLSQVDAVNAAILAPSSDAVPGTGFLQAHAPAAADAGPSQAGAMPTAVILSPPSDAVPTADFSRATAPVAIHLVGGGAQNALLCQLTADFCGTPVHAGPVEATVLGNAAVTAVALGAEPDLAAARVRIAQSFPPIIYAPRRVENWQTLRAQYARLIASPL